MSVVPAAAPVTIEPMEPLPYRVVRMDIETPDVATAVVVPVDRAMAPPAPGQFAMVWVFGVGEVPISVSRLGSAGEVHLTVRAVGAVSRALDAEPVGAVLGLRGPYGTAWPLDAAAGRDTVVVAGGLGFAPLRMAIDALAAGGPSRLTVLAGAREPHQLLYADDLARWAAAGVDVGTIVDVPDPGWTGPVGTTTELVTALDRAPEVAFVCGPERMMTSVAAAVLALGTPPDEVWLSLERNMHCGIGHCGRCQLGPLLLCRDGAVVHLPRAAELLEVPGR